MVFIDIYFGMFKAYRKWRGGTWSKVYVRDELTWTQTTGWFRDDLSWDADFITKEVYK